ncbi:MAG: glycosyltransferase family 4 protein [Patescibacteria group bacterium]
MQTPDIILITLDYPPEIGGVARYLGNLVKVSGGKIKVIVQSDHEEPGFGQIEKRDFFYNGWPKWWPIVDICRSALKSKETVILVSHVFPVGTAAFISRIFGGPEYAVIFHGLDLRMIRGAWKRFLLRMICSRAKIRIANSESTKEYLLKLVPKIKVNVITPAVEHRDLETKQRAREILNLDQERKIVLSVGRLIPRKGFDLSLEAMAEIQKNQEVEYVVVGNGPDLNRLQKIAEQNKTKVRWIMDADDQEKWLWFAAADIFLLPARDEGSDVEGFGIVYLEAGLAGIPVIAGKSGGVTEAVRQGYTGLLVDPESGEDVLRAIKELLGDEDRCKTMGAQARDRVLKEFRWEDRWDKLQQIIKSS